MSVLNEICEIGYNIEEIGIYEINFEIYSNCDIINFDFIKLYKSNKIYKVDNILKSKWKTIHIIIVNDIINETN